MPAHGVRRMGKVAVVDMAKLFAQHPSTAKATEELTESRKQLREEFKKALMD